MKESGAEKWDERYRKNSNTDTPPPCCALEMYNFLLPAEGLALDLACGLGGNALYLANKGLTTSAWDSSSVAITLLDERALNKNLSIATEVRDVIAHPPVENSFDVIVVSRFLCRAIVPALIDALKYNGLIFYQTFVAQNTGGPSRPEFVLDENELLSLFDGMVVRVFVDLGIGGDIDRGLRDESLLIVQKKDVGCSDVCSDVMPSSEQVPEENSEDNALPEERGKVQSMSTIDNFEAMLERGQDGDMLRFTLGNAYWKDSQPEKAVVHLQKAVELNPIWSAAWKILGRAHSDCKKFSKAIEVLEHGLEVAQTQGDKQTEKEIGVFLKRAKKAQAEE